MRELVADLNRNKKKAEKKKETPAAGDDIHSVSVSSS